MITTFNDRHNFYQIIIPISTIKVIIITPITLTTLTILTITTIITLTLITIIIIMMTTWPGTGWAELLLNLRPTSPPLQDYSGLR